MTDRTILIKHPAEIDVYDVDFTRLLKTGDTVDSITSVLATPAGLTITNTVVATPLVQFKISGGTDLVRYKISVIVVTVDGHTKETDVYLRIID